MPFGNRIFSKITIKLLLNAPVIYYNMGIKTISVYYRLASIRTLTSGHRHLFHVMIPGILYVNIYSFFIVD